MRKKKKTQLLKDADAPVVEHRSTLSAEDESDNFLNAVALLFCLLFLSKYIEFLI